MKERRTKRQRRGVNPDLDELNMSDDEIRAAKTLGTSVLNGLTANHPASASLRASDHSWNLNRANLHLFKEQTSLSAVR